MHVIGLLLGLLSISALASTEVTTQIYDLDYGTKSNDEVLVLLASGEVTKILPHNKDLLAKFSLEKTKGKWFKIIYDKNRFITKVSSATPPRSSLINSIQEQLKQTPYVPTTIASMDVAKKYFREARYNPKDSQCFNRAHVWSYEWWKKHSLKSNKILIYFTRTYIRRYNFEWWWHIAPMVHIMHEGKVVERVMDVKYTRGPLEIPRWTNIFMRNDAPCQVITNYSEYADNPYLGECYLQRANMYTYQAADLQMLEAWGYTKDKFLMDEVRGAYLEAFDERI